MKNLLGGKGANLAEMSRLGIPVPPGFTITTEVCTHYQNDGSYPEGLAADVDKALTGMTDVMASRFGDAENPLLVSVRVDTGATGLHLGAAHLRVHEVVASDTAAE